MPAARRYWWVALIAVVIGCAVGPAVQPAEAGIPPWKPDGMLKNPNFPNFVGEGIFNLTGDGQTISAEVLANSSTTWKIRAANAGTTSDRIRIIGGRINTSDLFTVKYLKGDENITKQVRSGEFKTRLLEPGDTQTIKAKITGNANVILTSGGTVHVLLVSVKGGASFTDLVRMVVDNN